MGGTSGGSKGSRRSVVVAGDVTMDWNLAVAPGAQEAVEGWNADYRAHASLQPGGAALLAALIQRIADRLRDEGTLVDMHGAAVADERIVPGDEGFHHSYAMWTPFERGGKESGTAWRVQKFLGLDRAADDGPAGVTDAVETPDLVILDDADLGFRSRPDLWPEAIRSGTAGRVVLKMARPVAQGKLWDHLLARPERLIVVMTINDLRLTDVQITRELSWERTAQDLIWELVHNPAVNALSRCGHVVVSFGTAGALLMSSEKEGPRVQLIFDPSAIENTWERAYPGGMIGYTSCLVASIARQVLTSPTAPDVAAAADGGLAAMRALHLGGYEERAEGAGRPGLRFPVDSVVEAMDQETTPFAVVDVPDPGERAAGSGLWTILEDRYPEGLGDLARRTLLDGAEETLREVPLGRFGKLLTVDRREIEGFRSIATLIREYSRQRRAKRPLSIGVFGPPGAGKSFGVVEVASSVLPDRIEALEFNLSQLGGPDDLRDALHRVRDAALKGRLPLVFWDEFDTALDGKPLGWLRHFLAPMQDGSFQEGQVVHPIGQAVFVFAGGTSERMETFGSLMPTVDFRAAKGPDFVSRLKGYVDILGPDPQEKDGRPDPHFIVRRAILLRSMLLRDAPHLFRKGEGRKVLQVDAGVARAFLHAGRYRHGARSMESIITMSLLSGSRRFERSCLPSEAQLALHTDPREFLALVQRLDLEGELLDRLAEAAHVVYCAGMLEEGEAWGEPDHDYLRRHPLLTPFVGAKRGTGRPNPSLVAYEHLTEELRGQNRDLVRDIPNKLGVVGHVMRPARGDDPPAALDDESIERLSEQEHERWMRAKIDAGWCYGPERDDERLLHPALLPWGKLTEEGRSSMYPPDMAKCIGPDELPEEQKEKDRDLIRGIPRILAAAGYTIAPLGR